MNENLSIEELEDYAFYESGLSADGCLERLDDYTRTAIEKYGRILLGKQKQDFIDGFEGCCYCCEPVGLLNQKLEKEIEKYKHILNSRQVKDIYLQTSANEKIKTLEKLVEQKTKDAEELKEMYLKEIANLEPYKFGVEEQKKYIKILEEKLQNNMKLKPTDFKDVKTANLYLDNYKQFGDAIMKANGNPFMVLERHNEFLITLANNNISITAKYNWDDEMPYSETKEYVDVINETLDETIKEHENNRINKH
jgi:hypothetical protein